MSVNVAVVVLKRRPIATGKPSAPRRSFSRPPTLNEIAAFARTMKERARRMRGVQTGNPHAFHEDKSDMARAWEKLEDAIAKGTLLSAEAE